MLLLKQWAAHRFAKSGIGRPLSTRLTTRGTSTLAVVIATTTSNTLVVRPAVAI